MDFSLLTFSIYVPDHDENEPVVAASPAAPPPPYSVIWHHGSLVCLPSQYMSHTNPLNVLPPPLLVEILAWVGAWEVGWRADWVRTLHLPESTGLNLINLWR